MLLALDTSTRLAGIALYDGEDGVVAEYSWHSNRQHTVELMPHVAALLAQAGLAPAGLQAVAVALGPGSFTGLRVALSAAKGLATAAGLGLVGVPTLDFTAYPHRNQPLPVIALVQAGRGRVSWARYEPGRAATRIVHSSLAELANAIDQPALLAGELTPATREALGQRLGDLAHFLPPALALRRPGYLAELAWLRFSAGDCDPIDTLSPIYLQEPGAPREG